MTFLTLQRELEQRLAGWRYGSGTAPCEARLVALKSPVEAFDASSPTPKASQAQQVEVHLLVYGIEIVCLLSTNGNGGRVLGAKTPCSLVLVQQWVAAAGEESMDQPFEVLLSALRNRWQETEQVNPPDVRVDKIHLTRLTKYQGSLEQTDVIVATPRKHQNIMNTTGSSAIGITVSDIDQCSPGHLWATVDTSYIPRTSILCSPGEGGSSQASSPSMASSTSEVPALLAETPGPAQWIKKKEPLLHPGGLAWDYPLSKDDKRELLLLHLLSSEQEAQNKIQQLNEQMHQQFTEHDPRASRNSNGTVASVKTI